MDIVGKCVFMIVLVLSDIPSSIRILAAGSTCNHPWKKDFGFKIDESVGVSVKYLPEILKGFLYTNITNQDTLEKELKMPLIICIKSLDCRLYTLLDKNNTNSITLCVVTKETKTCVAFTCTCPNERKSRSINTDQYKRNSSSSLGITKPTCKFESISDERIFNITQTNLKENAENCSNKYLVEYTTTMGNNTSVWLYILIFVLGVGIGTVFGGLATFIWFKRKYLLPKTSAVVNEIYNRETTRMSMHDVTEYSEIPESSIKTHSEDEYLVPLKKTDIVKYQEDIMECPVGVDALNHSSKEGNKPIMDTAHRDIDKNSVYFELSAVSESEKLFFRGAEIPFVKTSVNMPKGPKSEKKHFNTVGNAASEFENEEDHPTDKVYFELSKATI